MDKSRERARRLTIASAIIATIMILATKTSTVNYLAYYVGHEYFKATCIFSSLVVIETTIIMHIVAAALGDIVATRHNGATEERNISDYVWMASICARPCAICVAISSAHVLLSSTRQTIWVSIAEWTACAIVFWAAGKVIHITERTKATR